MRIQRDRRLACILLCCLLLSSVGCGAAQDDADADGGKPKETQTVSVVTTIFPVYDWVREITGGEGVELELLLKNGKDMHSYQPSVQDIAKLKSCDVLIYVGGESDEWIEEALADTEDGRPAAVNLLEALGDAAREEELPEGAEAPRGEEEEDAYDEHVWLSLANAKILAREICAQLTQVSGCAAYAQDYAANLEAYEAKLSAMDARYRECVDAAARKELLFCDRYPFLYMAKDYGLTCYAAFHGCSAETEASFETVKFLADQVNALSLPCVLTIDGSDGKLARTVLEAAGREALPVLTLNSMQAVTEDEIAAGATYLSLMEDNLTVLKEALR